MELKKYVLTDRNNIVDLSKGFNYANGHVGKFILKDDIVYSQYDDNCNLRTYCKIKKTSDNILDLVEVGDLLGVLPIKNGMLDLNGIKEEIVMVTILKTSKINTIFSNRGDIPKNEILAIYKRQSNGDYKRYEVGGKE